MRTRPRHARPHARPLARSYASHARSCACLHARARSRTTVCRFLVQDERPASPPACALLFGGSWRVDSWPSLRIILAFDSATARIGRACWSTTLRTRPDLCLSLLPALLSFVLRLWLRLHWVVLALARLRLVVLVGGACCRGVSSQTLTLVATRSCCTMTGST